MNSDSNNDGAPFVVDGPPAMTRRTAVKYTAAGLAGLTCGAGVSALLVRSGSKQAPSYHFFTGPEAALVIGLCEQIIPKDDTPGATDAGVIFYLDRQLRGPFAQHQELYRLGLAAFEKTCQQLHQRSFSQLNPDEKIGVMRLVESGKAPTELWQGIAQASFFSRLIEHTMQGFYGNPRHGGNRGYVSYKMLGLDYPQIIGRNR